MVVKAYPSRWERAKNNPITALLSVEFSSAWLVRH